MWRQLLWQLSVLPLFVAISGRYAKFNTLPILTNRLLLYSCEHLSTTWFNVATIIVAAKCPFYLCVFLWAVLQNLIRQYWAFGDDAPKHHLVQCCANYYGSQVSSLFVAISRLVDVPSLTLCQCWQTASFYNLVSIFAKILLSGSVNMPIFSFYHYWWTAYLLYPNKVTSPRGHIQLTGASTLHLLLVLCLQCIAMAGLDIKIWCFL